MPLVFGYGSLISPASAAGVLKRVLPTAAFAEARLTGHARTWTAVETVHSERLGRVVQALFLDVQPREGSHVNGVLLRVTGEEFGVMLRREKGYDPVEVSVTVPGEPGERSAVTFVSRPRHRVERPRPGEHFVLREYVRKVEEGCRARGAPFLLEFRATTDRYAAPLLEGAYRFVDPGQAQAV